MLEPRGFDDPGRDEWGCECGCETETRDELDDDGRCEACAKAGCYAGCCKRPWAMTVDNGDPEDLEARKLSDARSESQSRVLARWGWYSGGEASVQISLFDGHQRVNFACAPVAP